MSTVRNDFFKLGDLFVTVIGDDVKVGDATPLFTAAARFLSLIAPAS